MLIAAMGKIKDLAKEFNVPLNITVERHFSL